jgi:Fic family protein
MSGDAGKWKSRDNEIIEILPNGERQVRFTTVPAKDTPGAVNLLCRNYNAMNEEENLPPLLTLATFVLDLLCIHPFRDGNGRVSRLATTFLLLQHGYEVGRYVSLERLAEDSKEDYYRILQECSAGWHQGKNEIVPWWNYFLGILRRAYGDFQRHMESADARPAKAEMVRQAIRAQVGAFTLADLRAQVPAASAQLIKKVLAQIKKKHGVRLAGHGRGARWELP